MTMPRRPLSRTDRERLYLDAFGVCQKCNRPISQESFHVAHLRSHAHGGPTMIENAQAWCAPCNYAQGSTDTEDTRLRPRGWQIEALGGVIDIPQRLIKTKIATIAACPGAGKTLFAGFVFQTLYDAGAVDRVVVFVPRVTLVKQWRDALFHGLQLDLTTGFTHERPGTLGTINTYQSLTPGAVEIHQALASPDPRRGDHWRTLVILDEVHHLAELVNGRVAAWARAVRDLVGEVNGIKVVGVLNLSGTLWRSNKEQRISTIEYQPEPDGRILSVVNYAIEAYKLIQEDLLRPVDLFRRGATVEMIDLREATRVEGSIADLDVPAQRVVIRDLWKDQGWREGFVTAVLDRLEKRYHDTGRAPMKALIVASEQAAARKFQESADLIMRKRGLQPFTELAISDEPAAQRVLERFKNQKRVGILCTVDMAGEGYDCPHICVIGFASNKLTPLYVRQVVARAQRVTKEEMERLGQPLTAAVIVPDVAEVVERMKAILTPMRHEIDITTEIPPPPPRTDSGGGIGIGRYILDGVDDHRDGDAHVTGFEDGDVRMDHIRRLEPRLREVGVAESQAARFLYAWRQSLRDVREEEPFTPLTPGEQDLADSAPKPRASSLRSQPLSTDEVANGLQARLHQMAKWWEKRGEGLSVQDFQGHCNAAGGIQRGQRDQASPDQLRRAITRGEQIIQVYCEARKVTVPPFLQ